MQNIIFQDLGLVDYKRAWDYQEQLHQEIIAAKLHNRNLAPNLHLPASGYLLFCEHPPVITLGKSGKEQNLLMNETWLKQNGIDFYHINRGGDITFHGPQQLVGYPLLDLDNFFTDIDKYLRLLEEVVIRAIAEYGIKGERMEKATGVWLDVQNPATARKICAMGIRTSHWVTMHGFALNVNTDLNYFSYIIPCGLAGKQVTSLEKELGTKIPLDDVKEKLKRHFEHLFGAKLITKSAEVALK